MEKKKNITVMQNEQNVIAVEVMAESIKSISDGIKKLRSTRLNDKALFMLISHSCKGSYSNPRPSAGAVKVVIEGIESLESTYLKKVTK